ncbi:SDR family oxidoreductase [Amycolatopsis regifaucium]|uniref:Oxidoreductase n=1 Tax=Amycolatopsis regifaucium TaxID=546365 RepID=A0A154MM15_9PSEU|nr:SDR family oxidoreductase [Amycolatopsis regifaucium]KZB85090.1 oxidoreductase [Amycolatopsis regifaucium]OKA04115.1 oxidoreductase [Amycolatopsis regifaucium]SFH94271.1 NAD(P)-dependent dehydrogenase, short-chain alcohol dehydrogenase family [Amycolatopsis regifaucium]
MSGVLVVTGGSKGIGAAVCELAAARGYDVVVNYAGDAEAAEDVASRVRRHGVQAITRRGDVASETDVIGLFDAAVELGPLAGVVANAAITGNTPGRLDEYDVDVVRRVVDVNITGVFLCVREGIRRMSTRYGGEGGAIVTVSSTAVRTGSPGEWVHYAGTKAAVETMTYGVAQEVAKESIRVNAVAPGMIHTGLHAAAGLPDRMERIAPTIPMGRAGEPGEVAEAVLWLLSPAASYTTGTVLTVGGGR